MISRVQKATEGALFAPDRLFKVVLVGNSSVGKTSLLRSFCEGRFHPSTTATVGERCCRKVALISLGWRALDSAFGIQLIAGLT